MGGKLSIQNPDNYILYPHLDPNHITDNKPIIYYYLHSHTDTTQYDKDLNMFSKEATVYPYCSFKLLQTVLEDHKISLKHVRIIISAEMSEGVYDELQHSSKVEKMLLYTYKPTTRINNLKLMYPKIKQICFFRERVVKVIGSWRRDEEKVIIATSVKEREKLLKWECCYMSIVQEKYINRERGHQHLKSLMEKLNIQQQQIKAFCQSYHQAQRVKKVEEFIIGHSLNGVFAFQLLNQLCRCTQDPTKLAYIRLYANDLYHSVRARYEELSHKEQHYYKVFGINGAEMQKLLTESMFTFCGWLSATNKKTQPEPSKTDFFQAIMTIIVPKKGSKDKNCAGYVTYSQNIIFNPGNYFEIIHSKAIESGIEIYVKLVTFTEQTLDAIGPRRDLKIHLDFLEQQQIQYPGQLFSLKHKAEGLTYLKNLLRQVGETVNSLRENSSEEGVKARQEYQLVRVRLQIASKKLEQGVLEYQCLERFITAISNKREAYKVLLDEVCEYYCRYGAEQAEYLKRVIKCYTLLDKFVEWKDFFLLEGHYLHATNILKRIEDYLSKEKQSNAELRDELAQLERKQKEMEDESMAVAHPAYRCCLILQLVIHRDLGQLNAQIGIIEQIQGVLDNLLGAESKEKQRWEQRRYNVIQARQQARDEQRCIRELGNRRRKYQSKVQCLSRLFQNFSQQLDLEPQARLQMSMFDPISV